MSFTDTSKDTLKIIYLDVGFQGEAGGRLALRSRSMTYFSAMGERKANIAWNAVAKVSAQSFAFDTSSMMSGNAQTLSFGIQIINQDNQSLTFYMKDQADLDRIQVDIENSVKDFNTGNVKQPPSSLTVDSENSMLCFPPFAATEGGNNSTGGSVQSHRSKKTVDWSTVTGPKNDNESTNNGHPAKQGGGINRSIHSDANRSGRGGCDASIIASSFDGGDQRLHLDPESAIRTTSFTKPSSGGSSKDNGESAFHGRRHAPIITVMAEQPTNQPKFFDGQPDHIMVYKRKRLSCGTIFCIILALLLLIGIGVGIGFGFGRMSSSSNDEKTGDTTITTAAAVNGLSEQEQEDSTVTSAPVFVAAELDQSTVEVLQAAEKPVSVTEEPSTPPTPFPSKTTMAPTGIAQFGDADLSTTGPSSVALPTGSSASLYDTHLDPGCQSFDMMDIVIPNNRRTAIDVGLYGGSSYCRSDMLWCQSTEWAIFGEFSGYTDQWFRVIAFENSFCVADIEHMVKLWNPQGTQYDLHVYVGEQGSENVNSNGSKQFIVSSNDLVLSGESFSYYVLVKHRTGTSCEPWSLQLAGHDCL